MIAEHDVAEGTSADEEENYFVSMTDMMVGILFIFIIMLMMFALNFREKTDNQERNINIAEEVAETLREQNQAVTEAIAAIERAEEARAKMLADIERRLALLDVPVIIDERNGVLRLTEDAVRFSTDRSDLSPQVEGTVEVIGKVLGATLKEYADCAETSEACLNEAPFKVETVFIEGHTDVTGSDARNWALSTERAVNTYRSLVTAEPTLRKLRNSKGEEIMSVSGYSSTRPLPSLGTNERQDWDQNRRIDLRFVMENEDRSRLTEVQELLHRMEDELGRLRQQTAPSDAGPSLRGSLR
ncbi:OmpA family protein [Fulvimarina sp. MAC3]|uniref:OmpA family protein n=1 Tax=Fulvimarina sp. MAC3 TaxID=3148887 RepID=UPI0031FBE5EF